jgi:hypothetical protein
VAVSAADPDKSLLVNVTLLALFGWQHDRRIRGPALPRALGIVGSARRT